MLFSNILKDETFVPGARLALSLSLPWKSCGELTHPKITCASLCFVVLQPVALCYSAQRCLSKTPKRANWFR